ncbi:MAG: hypothetical protein ACE5GJ_01045 [Gemmatimonadota bacterium]
MTAVGGPRRERAAGTPFALLRRMPELRLAGLAFVVELLWELLQSPFYADTFTEAPATVLWYRVHCTGGDVLILLGAWGVAALVARSRRWYRTPSPPALAAFVLVGVAYTAFSEWRAVYVTHGWDYAPTMPTLGGIGVVPLVQWVLLPPLLLVLMRRWEAPRRRSPAAGTPRSDGPRRR